MIFGVGAVYDWLYDVLPDETRATARQYLVDCARWMRSPDNDSAWQWRSQGQWLANHKWWNYAALAMAASVLWDDANSPAKPAEVKQWMDEAMQVFWVVRQTFGPDGAPIEGYLYSSYGNAPYFSFAVLAEQLTTSTTTFVDFAGVREMGVSRLHSSLPNNAGFFPYADTEVRTFTGSEYFRLLASRFKDSESQLLADMMERGDATGMSAADNYDASVPPYSEGSASNAQLKSDASGKPVAIQAEHMDWPEQVAASMAKRVGSIGKTTPGWSQPANTATASFDVPADGLYQIAVKYSAGAPTRRSLKIDNAFPFRECSSLWLRSTGGWSADKDRFALDVLGESQAPDRRPWLFKLARGRHTIALTNDFGGGLNLDYIAVAPAGTDRTAIAAAACDSNPTAVPEPDSAVAPWRGLFWYDPSVAPADPTTLPLFRDNTDLGIYTARSSWTEPTATWLGLKCGPPAGKTATDLLGFATTSGHNAPDEGAIVFYYGSKAVLPGTNYCHEKLTSSSSVVVFHQPLKPDQPKPDRPKFLEQFGGGNQWFAGNYKQAKYDATVLAVQHDAHFVNYLCELGGVYSVGTGKDREPIYPGYRRSVTYLPSRGVLVVVDRVTTPVPRSLDFHLMTLARDLAVDENAFTFTLGRARGRIVDFSPDKNERLASQERISSFPNPGADPPNRGVATLRAIDRTSTVFAVVIGMNGAEQGISVAADGNAITINGVEGGDIRLSWNDSLMPQPPIKPAAR